MDNIYRLPFDDFREIDAADEKQKKKEAVLQKMEEIAGWCESQGVDITTVDYRHQAAVIMAQLQVILLGLK